MIGGMLERNDQSLELKNFNAAAASERSIK